MMNRRPVIRAINLLLLVILLAACMEMPSRDTQLQKNPVLWLYEQPLGEGSATLYRTTSVQQVELVAEHVVPGSHRAHGARLLFLDDRSTLYYAASDHEPYPLLPHILPYSYGFIDEGRKVFAVNERHQLLLRTYGAATQLLAEGVNHVVPLRNHLLARMEDGRVLGYDFYGNVDMTLELTDSLSAISDRYAAVISSGEVSIIDGHEILFTIHTDRIGSIHVARDGRAVLYLEHYDAAEGIGILTIQQQGEVSASLAEHVSQFTWDEARDQIWYMMNHDLYRYDMESQDTLLIAANILTFAVQDGGLLAVTEEGRLTRYDERGTIEILHAHDGGGVRWAEHFGSSVLYMTEDTGVGLIDAATGQVKQVGTFDSWIYDKEVIIGTEADSIVVMDRTLQPEMVLTAFDTYRYIYYGDRLLQESLLSLEDIAGTWHSDTGKSVVISRIGNISSIITIGDEEPVYSRVEHATHDLLLLTLTGRQEQQITIRHMSDGRIEVQIDDEAKELYRFVKE